MRNELSSASVGSETQDMVDVDVTNVTVNGAAALPLSIDIVCRQGAQQQTRRSACGGRMMGQTDRRTPDSFIDPATHRPTIGWRRGVVVSGVRQ